MPVTVSDRDAARAPPGLGAAGARRHDAVTGDRPTMTGPGRPAAVRAKPPLTRDIGRGVLVSATTIIGSAHLHAPGDPSRGSDTDDSILGIIESHLLVLLKTVPLPRRRARVTVIIMMLYHANPILNLKLIQTRMLT